MKKGESAKRLSLNIAGVRKLLLHVTDGGDDKDYDHADWAEARVVRKKE